MALNEGNGAFVDVTDIGIGITDMSDEITDTIGYTRAYADEMRTTLSESIENLESVVGSYNPVIEDIDTSVPGIIRPSFPARPSFGDLGLDTGWPDGDIPDPNFLEYGVLDFSYTAPEPPSDVDESFDWTQGSYSSDMWMALFNKVHTAVLNGDYGLTDDAHAALVAKEQESRRLNQDNEYRAGVAAVGSQGWNLPAGHTVAFLAEFHAEVLKRDQDALNTITIQDFEIANENQKFFISSAADLEKVLRATYEQAQNRSLEAAKAAKEYLARFFSENVKLYLGKWEGVKAQLEALKTKVDAIKSRNDGETAAFVGRADVLKSKVQAITEKNRGLVDTRQGEIDVYKTEVEAVASEFRSLVEEVKVNQEAVRIEIDKELRHEGLKLQAFSDKSQLAVAVGTGISNIGSQGVASALGAIHTSLSNSYSGTESRGEQFGFSAGITETHNYEEK